jgi:quercetin dioxygenase-like cupin family protein
MRILDVATAASQAIAPNPTRPATATLHDSADLRLVVFRLAAGQSVPPHRSGSTVALTAISGQGFVRGGDEERPVAAGDTVVFEPNELHGMRAHGSDFVLLATITPRPGDRSAQRREPNAASTEATS